MECHMFCTLVAFFIIASHSVAEGEQNSTYLPLLEEYINEGMDGAGGYSYDAAVRPNVYSTLELYAEFYLLGIGTVEEKRGKIVPSGFLIMTWKDERLTWNPQLFGNITTTVFDGHKIWSPKFIHNGDRPLPQAEAVLRADVTYEGQVSMVLSLHEETPCRFDMTKFPRDTQKCYIQLYHPDPMVHLHSNGGDIGLLSDLIDRGTHRHLGWKILNVDLNTSHELAGPNETNIYIITIDMERQAKFFLRIYVTPICFFLLLLPIIFLLPPDSSEKFIYGALLLLCLMSITQTVDSVYPPYTDSTPHLIQLTTASGVLLVTCIFLTSFISSAERVGRKNNVPKWIKKYILGVVGPAMLVRRRKEKPMVDSTSAKPMPDNDSRMYIIQSEQSIESIDMTSSRSTLSELNGIGESHHHHHGLQALTNELKQSRLQSKAQDDWTNVFTILNRFLFLLTLIIGIMLILCYAL